MEVSLKCGIDKLKLNALWQTVVEFPINFVLCCPGDSAADRKRWQSERWDYMIYTQNSTYIFEENEPIGIYFRTHLYLIVDTVVSAIQFHTILCTVARQFHKHFKEVWYRFIAMGTLSLPLIAWALSSGHESDQSCKSSIRGQSVTTCSESYIIRKALQVIVHAFRWSHDVDVL